jgi:opacity protein-like surface antigen
LGATYEYADYGSIDNRVNDGSYTDWYGDYYDDSHSDGKMNDNTEDVLKGVSTIKLGLEYKPIQEVAFRIGYNYLSPMFEKDGIRDGSLESPGVATAMSTDYTNWKSTNRFTFGVGYELKQFTLDLAYQYSQTNGDFYPFMSYTDDTDKANDNIATGTKVSNKRHQLALTIGYRF